MSHIFDAEYTATYFPLRDILKSKLSGRADDDAEFDTSSRSVRLGCACDLVEMGLLEALGLRSSSVMADVMAVEYPERDIAEEDVVASSIEDAANRVSIASTLVSELRALSSLANVTSFPLRSSPLFSC